MGSIENRSSNSKHESRSGDKEGASPTHGEINILHGTQERNGQKVVVSWLRDDCLEFYRTKLLHLTRYSSCASKTQRFPVIQVKDRVSLLRLGINKAMGMKKRFPNAQFLEFGVHEGKDLVRMATFLRSVEEKKSYKQESANRKEKPCYTKFHGFDSFEGLPEDWVNGQIGIDDKPLHKQGAFGTAGETPNVDYLVDKRLRLGKHGRSNYVENNSSSQSKLAAITERVDNIDFHKGWFHESLPRFLDDHDSTPIAFVHADADLYSSTLTFLRLICHRRLFKKGSVIVFDEFWNYPNWENGEYKAWLEIVDEFGLESKYEYFGYHAPHPTAKKLKHYGYQSVGVVMTSNMD